jgi:hypothetical protein
MRWEYTVPKMITCIVNPSRCGSTLLLHILDKYFRMSRTPNYSMEYEIIDEKVGAEVLKQKSGANFLFKYQFLFTIQPLLGADKYIVLDRKDKDAWIYSSFMSFMHHNPHGKLENKEYEFDEVVFNHHKDHMFRLLPIWEKEKSRLIDQGAVSLWYEDIKDKSAADILQMCGYPGAAPFDKDDLYFRGIKLEKVWSCKRE